MARLSKHEYRKMHPSSDNRKHEKQKKAANQQKPGKPEQQFNASTFGQGLVNTTQNRSKAVEKANAVVARQRLTGSQADKMFTTIMNAYDSVVRGRVGVNRKHK
ncbi:MAG: hypothetical protein NT067_03040 [Candidatus Diapherotrites archaeon]|nr:hypothetical protein [Candidatus Diapherotrites archaeon]